MGNKDKEEKNSQPEPSIEESFDALEEIAQKLESRETTLEESFQIYQKGMQLLKNCSEKIDTVEKKMLQMDENGELSEF